MIPRAGHFAQRIDVSGVVQRPHAVPYRPCHDGVTRIASAKLSSSGVKRNRGGRGTQCIALSVVLT
jgi:hypothetical protein